MKAIEEVDVEKLVESCKAVNEVIDAKIEVVGVATVDLIKSFTAALEAMTDEQQDKAPAAVEFYNDLYADEAGVEPTPPADPAADPPPDENKTEGTGDEAGKVEKDPKKNTTTKKKKKAATAKKKKEPKEPKEPKPPKEKDEFGFTVGTKNNLFIQAIKETPMKMKDIRECEWNEKKITFYEIFKKMKAEDKVDLDEEGRMYVK